ncbi:restriction endonuclease [Lysobacter sp. LF1]|uniref:Restriction endonuclease n=1 Tax=Lysobacter stagni TaxID=3045172 RepID=A0ABT6XHB3_9GAMM|nr:restriction endonuclease [Lysobacter sp. LF1]MDI9239547.1 restriction endonuclease [Lysobacter sp. LF1]
MKGLKGVANRRADALARVSWDRLEALLAAYYRSEGYEVEHVGTGATGAKFDGGIDLKLRRGEQFIIVQCKHWNAMKVPHNAVHELLGLMVNHGATGAILANSGEFTKAAIEAAQKLGHVQLIDGDELRMMLGPIREPATAFDAVRMGAADGAGTAMARRLGERLLSATGDRTQSPGATRSVAVVLAYKVLVTVLFLGFVLLMYHVLVDRITATLAPKPPASAPPVSAPVQTVTALPPSTTSQADPCHEVIDAASGSYIDHCASGETPRATARSQREQQRRAEEAMKVIKESTPEL